MLVDRGILLDVRIRRRHVGLRLVIVVVRDEVLDRVVREELAELAVELRGQRLVVRQDHRRPLHALDHVRDAERLARAGDAEQGLMRQTRFQTVDQLVNGLWLIARGLIRGFELERIFLHTRRDPRQLRCRRVQRGCGLADSRCPRM